MEGIWFRAVIITVGSNLRNVLIQTFPFPDEETDPWGKGIICIKPRTYWHHSGFLTPHALPGHLHNSIYYLTKADRWSTKRSPDSSGWVHCHNQKNSIFSTGWSSVSGKIQFSCTKKPKTFPKGLDWEVRSLSSNSDLAHASLSSPPNYPLV